MVFKRIGLALGLLGAGLFYSSSPAFCDYESDAMVLFRSKPAILAKTNVIQRFSEYAQLQPGEDDVTLYMVLKSGGGAPSYDWVEIASPSMQTVYVKKNQFVNGECEVNMTGKLGDGYNQLFVSGAGPAGASLSWSLVSPRPTVTGLSTLKTGPGDKLTINGTNLPTSVEAAQVTIGGRKAQVLTATPTAVTIRTPSDLATGTANVQLQFGTFASNPIQVSVAAVVTLTSVDQQTAAPGNYFTVTGTNFSANVADDVVYVGPFEAHVDSATTTQLRILVPANYATMFPQTGQAIEVVVRGVPSKNKLLINIIYG